MPPYHRRIRRLRLVHRKSGLASVFARALARSNLPKLRRRSPEIASLRSQRQIGAGQIRTYAEPDGLAHRLRALEHHTMSGHTRLTAWLRPLKAWAGARQPVRWDEVPA